MTNPNDKHPKAIEPVGKAYRDAANRSNIAVNVPFMIRALRKKRGWTQMELARRSGVSQWQVGRLEHPALDNLPTLQTMCKLAAAFDVAVDVRFVTFGEFETALAAFDPETYSVDPFVDQHDPVARVTPDDWTAA